MGLNELLLILMGEERRNAKKLISMAERFDAENKFDLKDLIDVVQRSFLEDEIPQKTRDA